MMLSCKGICDTSLSHDRETDAVCKRPRLIMPIAVKLHATSKPQHMIGNEQRIGVCEYALKETMCTLPYYWRTEGISHFHENPGSGDQRLTRVLSCLDSSSMVMNTVAESRRKSNSLPSSLSPSHQVSWHSSSLEYSPHVLRSTHWSGREHHSAGASPWKQ
jgi:hypothetical protein